MKPVCLPTSKTCLPAGSTCVVSGWGNTDRLGGARFPDRLQEAAVKILDEGFCKNPDPNNTAEPIKNKYYQKLYNENMVCAGSADAFTDACQGQFIISKVSLCCCGLFINCFRRLWWTTFM